MEKKNMSAGKRKKVWPYVLAGIAVVLVLLLLLGIWGVNALRRVADSAALSGVVQTQAERRDIVTTAVGTGSLDFGDREELKLPDGLFIREIFVDAGESVQAGEALLEVDENSVRGREQELLSQLQQLDMSIGQNKPKDDETLSVRAYAEGRVKAVYVEEGETSEKALEEHGALMLLSIDGKMAVNVPAGSLEKGDEPDVRTEDKTYKGEVESVSDGQAVITFTDNGPKLDGSAGVLSDDDEVIGEGVIYIHQPLAVVSQSGKVEDVSVKENEKVSVGKVLLKLKDIGESVEYRSLLDQRAQIEETLQDLRTLENDPVLYAPASGVVEALYVQESEGAYVPGAQQAMNLTLTAADLAKDETMKLVIDADELDILSISEGQTAAVEFDAIEGRAFSGQIVKVAPSTTSVAGVAKYSVEIELEKDEDMRAGMSATATVTVVRTENALTIPVAALQEKGMEVYVYTALGEDGQPAGERSVTTGVSDGEYVEVLEGLDEGEEVYYVDNSSLFDFPFPMARMMQDNMEAGE